MGSSAKKKREKKKDFQVPDPLEYPTSKKTKVEQKAKLRVGKTKPKPANHTETSFKSKGEPQLRNLSRKY